VVGHRLFYAPRAQGFDKSLNDLTFGEYVDLLLHKSRADRVKVIFDLEPKAIKTMLNAVRETRNALAHFRGDISPKQRDQLQFCKEWLTQRQKQLAASVNAAFSYVGQAAQPRSGSLPSAEGRYEPLIRNLSEQPADRDTVPLTFVEIETMIGDRLPESARQHQKWWDNDPDTYPAQLWLDAGWRVSWIDMTEDRVVFSRLKGFRTLQGV